MQFASSVIDLSRCSDSRCDRFALDDLGSYRGLAVNVVVGGRLLPSQDAVNALLWLDRNAHLTLVGDRNARQAWAEAVASGSAVPA
jgi:hypothetical protein